MAFSVLYENHERRGARMVGTISKVLRRRNPAVATPTRGVSPCWTSLLSSYPWFSAGI